MSNGNWKLVRDDDCHWYVIPADKKPDWEAWQANPEELDEHDCPKGWTVPDYAEAVGGAPSLVTFNADGTYTIG